jgi:hypothetical protein
MTRLFDQRMAISSACAARTAATLFMIAARSKLDVLLTTAQAIEPLPSTVSLSLVQMPPPTKLALSITSWLLCLDLQIWGFGVNHLNT